LTDSGVIVKNTYRKIRMVAFDTETAEPVEGIHLDCKQVSPKHFWGAPFLTVFQIVEAKNITPLLGGEAARILLFLLLTVGIDNTWNLLNQREIAEEMNMCRSQVSRALAELTSMNIILKGNKFGSGYAYKLNPRFGWKGDFRKHAAERHKAPDLVAA
jgi:hypothetical protein